MIAGFGVVASVAVVLGDNTVAVFGTPIFARLGSVTILDPSGSGVVAVGVYANVRVGNVYIRQYNPVSWVSVRTIQSPGWTAVIT